MIMACQLGKNKMKTEYDFTSVNEPFSGTHTIQESLHPKSKFINSPEPTYFEQFDMR